MPAASSPPPFRAEHIGSLLRPAALLESRARHAAGRASDQELADAENAAIRNAVAMQQRVGLKLATDGEFRRESYHGYFYGRLGDISLVGQREGEGEPGVRGAQPQAVIRSRIKWTSPIHAADFAVVRSLTSATPKITIPGPCALHFRGGDKAVLAHAYKDVGEFWDDTVAAFTRELADLAAAGCTYVQIDETAFAKFGDLEVQAALAARGDDWSTLIDQYIAVTNRILAVAPKGMAIGMHLCRGNRGGRFHAEGSYESVSERLFNTLDINFFFLEYDSPRAGDFSPLRFVPAHKHIVLGLVSTKTGAMETMGDLERRIAEAATYVELPRLALSPQCGFASIDTGNPLSQEDQEAKLRLVVQTAEKVWGSA
ncbi:MAG: 5-methyltetrahydropteroyltriglutamate--homocysteine S-methyltransferase [Hyphomicrobiaceae bacterium]